MANKLTCAECAFYFGDMDEYGYGDRPYCHFCDNDGVPPCEAEPSTPKYTVVYEGFLFEGDTDGLNRHDTDSHDEAFGIANAYPDIVYVDDNEYGVTWHNGEWY